MTSKKRLGNRRPRGELALVADTYFKRGLRNSEIAKLLGVSKQRIAALRAATRSLSTVTK